MTHPLEAPNEEFMRLSVNAALHEAAPPEQAELQLVVKTAKVDDSLVQVVSELSHDLRQPLTSLNMNLQCAVKMLQSPTPQISAALEALADCLSTEKDMVELVAQAKRRVMALSTNTPVRLNDIARDLLLSARNLEPDWRMRLNDRFLTPSPLVSSGFLRLRLALLSILRRSLILDESDPGGGDGVVIETRSLDDRAELRFTGLPPSLPASSGFQSLYMLITSLVGYLNGHAQLVVQDTCVTFVVSAPVAPMSTLHLPGGRHGV